MDTDLERGKETLEQTRGAYAAKNLLVVHYECGPFGQGRQVPVHAICVKDISRNETQVFTAHQNEKTGLSKFAYYVQEHKDFCWMHWNMNDSTYGFEHIKKRLGFLAEHSLKLPENRVDLGNACWQLYGDTPHGERGRLMRLCVVNGITTRLALTSDEIQNAVKERQWPAVEASVNCKVDMIHAIWSRMSDDNLIILEPTGGTENPISESKAQKEPNWSRVYSKKEAAGRIGISVDTLTARLEIIPQAGDKINRQAWRFDKNYSLFMDLE